MADSPSTDVNLQIFTLYNELSIGQRPTISSVFAKDLTSDNSGEDPRSQSLIQGLGLGSEHYCEGSETFYDRTSNSLRFMVGNNPVARFMYKGDTIPVPTSYVEERVTLEYSTHAHSPKIQDKETRTDGPPTLQELMSKGARWIRTKDGKLYERVMDIGVPQEPGYHRTFGYKSRTSGSMPIPEDVALTVRIMYDADGVFLGLEPEDTLETGLNEGELQALTMGMDHFEIYRNARSFYPVDELNSLESFERLTLDLVGDIIGAGNDSIVHALSFSVNKETQEGDQFKEEAQTNGWVHRTKKPIERS